MNVWQFIASVTIGVISAVVTSWLALRRFRTERWWERKADAYDNLMEHLADMEVFVSEWLSEQYREKQLSPERKHRLQKRHNEATIQIRRAKAVGDFYISSEAARKVDELVEELDKSPSGPDLIPGVERHLAAIRACIADVGTMGKNDLETKAN